ncbi:hypothetical protein TNCV_2463421 [Trichonephila clavipes]|nr:hypothetical protein TNCV_2463421 [Trichonephila clavipes]
MESGSPPTHRVSSFKIGRKWSPNPTVICMVLKVVANDKRKLVSCHDEFRRLLSDTFNQMALETKQQLFVYNILHTVITKINLIHYHVDVCSSD